MSDQAMIVDQGQIASMTLPSGFSEEGKERREFPDYLRQFASNEDATIKLSFYYRGHKVAAEPAQRFQRMLASGQRDLSKEELLDISAILRDAANSESFQLRSSCVLPLKDRHILAVTGTWRRSSRKNLAIFIDADGSGSVVQEIHYVASEEKFDDHCAAIMESLETITWKKAAG